MLTMQQVLAAYMNGQDTLAFGTRDWGLLPLATWHRTRGQHSEIPYSLAWPYGVSRLPRILGARHVRDRNGVATHVVHGVIVDGPGRNTTFDVKSRIY